MDEAFLNDLLECSVCLEQLDGSSKVLPCQHTFCKRCLEEIVHSHKELRCPECRVLVEIKVDDLPNNILLIRLLEGIKNNPRLKSANGNAKKTTPSSLSQRSEAPRSLQSHGQKQVAQIIGEHKTTVKQTVSQPCAKALCTYEGKELGDLSFNKGDMIILQRRIDHNWYHGMLNGKYGFVQARHVRVVVPLPTHVPQCKALYDFSVVENEEKDCLTFKKGEVITVIRRIDDNWAEGRLCDRIGIFPISFVEMNVAARSLMKLSVNSQPGPSRVAPPTPGINSLHISAFPSSKQTVANSTPQAPDYLSSATTTPSPSSSTSPSVNTPSSSSSPSLHQAPSISTSVAFTDRSPCALTRSASQRDSHQREKRHSISSISSCCIKKSPQMSSTHKHSSEILSTAGGDILVAPSPPASSPSTCLPLSESVAPVPPLKSNKEDAVFTSVLKNACSRNTPQATGHENHKAVSPIVITSTPSAVSTGASKSPNCATRIPMFTYVALYNYRPKKEDELQLKKGEFYAVSEKCQDGWFKGTSFRTGRSGVFPGNYVQIVKPGHPIRNPRVPSDVSNVRSMGLKPMMSSAISTRQKSSLVPLTQVSQMFCGNAQSSNGNVDAAKSGLPENKTSFAAGLLDCVRFTSAPQPSSRSTVLANPSVSQSQEATKDNSVVSSLFDFSSWMDGLLQNTNTPSMSESLSTAHESSTAVAQPERANLTLSNITGNLNQSWHAGKSHSSVNGSEPPATSMSVMSPPNITLRTTAFPHSSHSKAEKHKLRKEKIRDGLVKRFTARKKTSRYAVANFCDNPSFVGLSSGEVAHSRSGSCSGEAADAPTTNQPKSSQGNITAFENQASAVSYTKQPSLVRERFRCVVPYPPNSEYELELKVGDLVYVHKKREDGWFKGTLVRTGKTGLFPASFVDSF